VSLPAADDLFRPTSPTSAEPSPPAATDPAGAATDPAAASAGPTAGAGADAPRERSGAGRRTSRKPSGRVRHDEKMTVYVTSDELLEIEHARLLLRRDHDLAVDRGRLVREAIAMVLADFEGRGEQSALVRRLSADG
jgi:hypothetical protein